MSALVFLFVVESFVFGAMWHNKSPQSEREHESERPDWAVLFSRRSPNLRKQALSVQVQTTVERPHSTQQIKVSTI